MAELFKFRCSQCAKLLGISRRKVGKAVHCPRCQAELIVPSPDDQAQLDDPNPGDEGDEFADLGIDLGFASPLDIRPVEPAGAAASAVRPPIEEEALAFLGKIAEAGYDEPGPTSAAEPSAGPGPAAADATSDYEDEPEPLVATPSEPLVPRSRRGEAAFDRRRDVVLPRTAVIAWALFALFALALSFVAGLLIGHYRWK